MIKSMTGYGRGQNAEEGKQVSIEVKSVNHRFLEVVVRIPRQYNLFEEKIKNLIKERIIRGRVDVFFNLEETGENKRQVKVDKELAIAYYNSLKELAKILNIPENLGIFEISQLPDIIIIEEQEEDLEKFWPTVEKAVAEALDGLIGMRLEEGQKLKNDLLLRRSKILKLVSGIEMQADRSVEVYHRKLLERVTELLEQVPVDEQRLAMEVAIMADKSNITEELVRLKSHLEQLVESVETSEPVGRKLDFLVQEMNREINTIGSKANDLDISQKVVAVKSELEKIREQVQNLE